MTSLTCERSGPGWYVAQVEPRGEVDVCKDIRAELALETYCPVERMWGVRRGKRIEIARPLIPGYLFVSFDRYLSKWQAIERIDGVMGLLYEGSEPGRVPTAWVEATRHAESWGIFDRTKVAPNGFKVGDHVRLADGPFAGHHALIQEFIAKLKSATARKRARVLVSFMGRMASIELPVESLERL